MIFLRVLPKKFCVAPLTTTRGPQELGGPGSLNRLNPRLLRHWCDYYYYYLLLLLLLLFILVPSAVLLHCALSLAAQCIVIGPVCGFVAFFPKFRKRWGPAPGVGMAQMMTDPFETCRLLRLSRRNWSRSVRRYTSMYV